MDIECDDIEMMDTEDNSFSSKRSQTELNQQINDSYDKNLAKNTSKDEFLGSRKILKAKRSKTISKTRIDFNKNKKICVLDTNILLSDLNQLKSVIISEKNNNLNDIKIESFIIPYIVVQELDHMKTGKSGSKLKFTEVINAINFINEQLKTNGLVKSEQYLKSIKEKQNYVNKNDFESVEEEVNDDKIINCCLRFKTFTDTILISNDINLCNKALMIELKAMNWSQFFREYNDKQFLESDDNKPEPPAKRLAKRSPSKSNDNKPSRIPLTSKVFKKMSDISHLKNHKKPYSSLKSSPPKYSSTKSCSPSKNKSPLKISSIKPLVFNEKVISYEDWIQFKYEFEQTLKNFIITVYQKIWGKEWEFYLGIDTKNINLKEMIRLVRKEWLSSFSDVFDRDSSVKSLIDCLHTDLQTELKKFQSLYKDLNKFKIIICDHTDRLKVNYIN